MRLTVRTLLAYLDNVLDEADSQALAAKLEDSPFAKGLADRIRDSISDTGSSPPVNAAHPIENANTIAEYLDNVLAAQHIPEVEKILIESQTHLSEAAACHQILTLVLSRPANVPHHLREKLYRLALKVRQAEMNAEGGGQAVPDAPIPGAARPHQSADSMLPSATLPSMGGGSVPPNGSATHQPADGNASDVTGAQPVSESHATQSAARTPTAQSPPAQNTRHDIPDYLRAGRPGRILPWIISACLCAALLFIMAQAFKPAIDRLSGTQPISDAVDSSEVEQPVTTIGDAPVVEEVTETEASNTTDNAANLASAPEDSTAIATASETSEPAEAMTSQPTIGNVAASETEASVASDVKVPEHETTPTKVPNNDPTEPAVAEVMAPDVSDDTPATTDVPTQHKPVGTYKSPESLLLLTSAFEGSEDDGKGMRRVKQDAPVQSNFWYANMPMFRNELALDGGVSITAVDSTDFALIPTDDSTPQIVLEYGGILLKSASPDKVIPLRLGQRESGITLGNADAVASVMVGSFRSPGADPAQSASIVPILEIRAINGDVSWEIEGIDPVKLAPGTRWMQSGNAIAAVDVSPPPAWTQPAPISKATIEEQARSGLLSLDEPSKKIEMVLREAVDFRRAEVAALAARCLLHLGVPDVYFGSDGVLNKESQKAHWQSHFKALQSQLNRSGSHAKAVKDALVEMNAAEATPMYRLLWGRSQAELETGGDFELVEALGSSSMSIRVLGIENLRQITGTTLYYRPYDIATRRSIAVKKWDTRVQKKDIRWLAEPKPGG